MWAVLNGHERAPPQLQEALERLVGVDHAAVVIDGIPQHPRLSGLEKILVLSVVVAVLAFEVWFFFFAGSSLPKGSS